MTVTASDHVFVTLMALKDKVMENMKEKEDPSQIKEGGANRGTTKTAVQGGVPPPVSRPGIVIEEVKKPSASMLEGIGEIEEEEKKDPNIF